MSDAVDVGGSDGGRCYEARRRLGFFSDLDRGPSRKQEKELPPDLLQVFVTPLDVRARAHRPGDARPRAHRRHGSRPSRFLAIAPRIAYDSLEEKAEDSVAVPRGRRAIRRRLGGW